jgi:anti-sigma B factor antagonist
MSEPPLVQIEHDDGQCVLVVLGDIDVSNADWVCTIGVPAVQTTVADEILINLSAVTFIDSSGLGALIMIRNAAVQRSLPLSVVGASRPVRRTFSVTGLDEVFGLTSGPTESWAIGCTD